ncbi:MAG: ATP-dependent metallopeptidase FtsH/Yme1/Tma family protein, partial [Isosphaeraceae bacterium]
MGVFLVILVGNLLLGLCGPAQQTVIPYSDFVAQVKFGNVKSATFLGNQIDGEFVHPFKGQSGYLTQEPPGESGLIQLLLDNKVQVSATQSPFDWF